MRIYSAANTMGYDYFQFLIFMMVVPHAAVVQLFNFVIPDCYNMSFNLIVSV